MIIGIDLGTTNSLVAVWRDGQAELLPNALDEVMTPSVVGLDDAGQVLVGRAARERLVTHPELTGAAFKRYMGTERQLRLGRREFRPEELSALVIGALKADAEAALGEPVTEAVITVPAYFNDKQRRATRLAGELAGLRVERLLNEPTAAALAYGLQDKPEENHSLVFDLGGGTFDVSILEYFEGVMEVHASAGDNFLGGEDFVDLLVAEFLREQGLRAEQLKAGETASLRAQAEAAKRALSGRGSAELRLHIDGEERACRLDSEGFAALAEPLLARLREPVVRALRDSRLAVADIDQVVLIGGATRMPLVQQLVARLFGQLPLRQINPDEAVALGAAVQAGLKARDAALDDVVLTDVCPYTLGIETSEEIDGREAGGLFSPIIERNTIIPASRAEHFFPRQKRQRQVELKVYQGESRFTRDNILLGAVTVPLPGGDIEDGQTEVRFSYDINGLLEVDAKVLKTGVTKQLVIDQAGGLSDKELAASARRLGKLKLHPRDDAANQAVLSRATRLYEQRIGAERQWLAQLIDEFQAVLARQDPREIQQVRREVGERLDALEQDSPL